MTGVSFVYCTKFCVLNRNIGHKQLALFGFPFSLWGTVCCIFLQFYRRRWERSIGLCHRVKNLRNCRNSYLRGWEFWCLETIKLFPRFPSVTTISLRVWEPITWSLGEQKGGSMKTLEGFRGGAMSQFLIIIALCNTCRNL